MSSHEINIKAKNGTYTVVIHSLVSVSTEKKKEMILNDFWINIIKSTSELEVDFDVYRFVLKTFLSAISNLKITLLSKPDYNVKTERKKIFTKETTLSLMNLLQYFQIENPELILYYMMKYCNLHQYQNMFVQDKDFDTSFIPHKGLFDSILTHNSTSSKDNLVGLYHGYEKYLRHTYFNDVYMYEIDKPSIYVPLEFKIKETSWVTFVDTILKDKEVKIVFAYWRTDQGSYSQSDKLNIICVNENELQHYHISVNRAMHKEILSVIKAHYYVPPFIV